jgi:hypothetical protein
MEGFNGKTLIVAAFLGLFAHAFQTFWSTEPTLMAPLKTALIVVAIHLWTLKNVETCAIARVRRGNDWGSFAANSFAIGYPWGTFMFLLLAAPDTILMDWSIWLCAGAAFGVALTVFSKSESLGEFEEHYDEEHVLDSGSSSRRFLFITWPFITLAFITILIVAPPPDGWNDDYIPIQLAVFCVLWPSAYEPKRKTHMIGLYLLGLVLVLLTFFLG